MSHETCHWFSPALQRDMPVARWGYHGKPVLLFPTAGGDFLECDRFLMVRALAPLLEAGRIKLYACGSISSEAWLSQDAPPWHKSWLQARFDQYLLEELLPFIHQDCAGTPQRFAAAGASLGAYNALTAATKHPEWFDLAIPMSGTYDLRPWMGAHWDENHYFNDPLQFLPGLEGPQLDRLRQGRFVIATGQGRWEDPSQSIRVAELLEHKGVPCQLELWGHDVDHDWPTWRAMLPRLLGGVV